MTSKDYFLKAYSVGPIVGEGNFSVVKKAVHRFTHEVVAIKIVNKRNLPFDEIHQISQEIVILKLIQHPNIVRLYEIFQDLVEIYMVLEYADCNLYYYLRKFCKEKSMSEKRIKHYFRQIVSALSYLHRFHVLHRDLKPQNVLLFNDYQLCKITDFGLSSIFQDLQDVSVGTFEYMAPEIVLKKSSSSQSSDIWSLGVILYMMAFTEHPFYHVNPNEMMVKIIECKYLLDKHLSSGCKLLIKRILVKDSKNRAKMKDILDDEWLNGGSTSFGNNKINATIITVNKELHEHIFEDILKNLKVTPSEIKKSLEDDVFNHIWAYYHLLAESLVKDTLKLDYSIKVEADKNLLKDEPSKIPTKLNLGGLRKSLVEISRDINVNLYRKSTSDTRKTLTKSLLAVSDIHVTPSPPNKHKITKFYSSIDITDAKPYHETTFTSHNRNRPSDSEFDVRLISENPEDKTPTSKSILRDSIHHSDTDVHKRDTT